MSRTSKAHLLLILITFIWGSTFVLIKAALRDIDPFYLNAIRNTLAILFLVAVYGKSLRNPSRGAVLWGIANGVLFAAGYEFQTTGLVYTTPSKSAFITGSSVVMVPLIMALIWRKMVRPWTALGVLMALFGLYLLSVPAGGLAAFAGINRGDLLTFGCALSFALQIVMIGHATRLYSHQQIVFYQVVAATLLMWFAVPVLGHPHAVWSITVLVALVVTALLCTAVAFAVQAWAQQFTPPTHTALIFSLEPVFAALTSFIVIGERLGWRGGIGGLLILAGVLVSELLGSSAQPQPEPAQAEASVSAEQA